MSMINTKDILETIKMIEEEHLDIRTITMGISLRDLAADDINVLADKVYDKVTRRAEKLVATGEQIERELGIPIINKRISVTPIAMVGATSSANSYVPLAKAIDRAAETTGVNFVGGFSALVQKGFAKGDEILINSIPEAMAETNLVCSSVNVASTKAGVNLDAIGLMGRIIKQTAELTKDNDSMGCSKLVVFANAVDDNPFMAGAFHGIGEPETVINVGVSGPGVVQSAIRRAGDCSIGEVADDAHVRKTRLTAELGGGVEGAFVELAGKQAAGAQHIGRRIEQAAEDIKAVGAALERQVGLKVLDLVRQRAHDVGRDVRRIGDEHVERTPLLAGNGAHQIGEAKGDLVGCETEHVAVFCREVDGARFDIGSSAGDVAAALPGKGKRDAARAAADLENASDTGLDRSGRGGIPHQGSLLVGTFDGGAIFVEFGLSKPFSFRSFSLLGLCGGFLGLAIGQLLGIGTAAQYVAA